MSVGNLLTNGNKGNNFPFQNALLQLQGTANTTLTAILAAIGGAAGADYELWPTSYKANRAGTGYSNGDFIQRVNVINAVTSAVTATVYFNETTGLVIAAPLIADVDPYTPPSHIVIDSGVITTVGAVTAITNALPAGENHLGSIGGNSVVLQPTITTSASAYTANDNVGGILTLAAGRTSGGSVVLQSLEVLDFVNAKQPFTVLFFSSNPAAATVTDNSPFVWSTDYQKCIGKFDVAAADYVSTVGIGLATYGGIGKIMVPNGAVNIFAVIVTTGTPTYAANATSLYVRFTFLQD